MRLNDWQIRFSKVINDHLKAPFAWGTNDCVLFPADCALAITGFDPAAGVRGTYSDERGAAKVLKALGGMRGLVAKFLGERISPSLGQPGDVGMVLNEGRYCFCVCAGERWFLPSAEGLVSVEGHVVERAWRLEPSNKG